MPTWLPFSDFSLSRTGVVVLAVAVLASIDLIERFRHKNLHLVFAAVVGTMLSMGLLKFTEALFVPGIESNGHIMALGFLFIVLGWKLLFGPWDSPVKAAVLSTFVFWVGLHMLIQEEPTERMAHYLAIIVALIPAVVWCALFLEYHRERISVVLLMFFAGMMSTAPVLFYDALVRRNVELSFFFFRIAPESFNTSVRSFVNGHMTGGGELTSTLLAVFLS